MDIPVRNRLGMKINMFASSRLRHVRGHVLGNLHISSVTQQQQLRILSTVLADKQWV